MYEAREHTIYTHAEDRSFQFANGNRLVAGVCDGHGGVEAARLVAQRFESVFHDFSGESLNDALVQTFRALHRECCQLPCASGCTLTVVVLDTSTGCYTCANVGDSLALHVTPTSHMRATLSHRLADNVEERAKLRDHVSIPSSGGPPRLMPGGLACSRTIGDADCPHAACEPFLHIDFLDEGDSLVLCSDGVWDYVSEKRVCDMLRTTYNPEAICREAQRRKSGDDATAVIVTRNPKKTSYSRLFSMFSRSSSESSLEDESIVKVPVAL